MVERGSKFVSRAPFYAAAALAATVVWTVAGPAATAWADDTPAGAQVAGSAPPPGEPLVTDQIVIDAAEMTSGQIPIKPDWREPTCSTLDPTSCAETPVQADSAQTGNNTVKTGYDCAVARPVAPDFNPDLNGPPDLFCVPVHDAG
jgi:hypothetical protein